MLALPFALPSDSAPPPVLPVAVAATLAADAGGEAIKRTGAVEPAAEGAGEGASARL